MKKVKHTVQKCGGFGVKRGLLYDNRNIRDTHFFKDGLH